MKHLRCTRAACTLALALLAAPFTACVGPSGDSLFANGGSTGTGGASSTSSGTAGTTSSSSGTTSTSSGATGCQTGHTCVDADPPGWTGHWYLHQVTLPAGPPAACPAGLVGLSDSASPAGAAQCTACTCGTFGGAACAPPTLSCWVGSTQCTGFNGVNLTQAYQDGACHSTSVPGGGGTSFSCKLTSSPTVTAPGGCPPSVSDFPNKESFQQRIDACGASQPAGTCGAGKVCIPDGAGSPGESLCIRAAGVVACPAGWPHVVVAYGAVNDTRACGACSCNDTGTTCSDAHYTFYTAPQCMAAGTTGVAQVSSTSCTDLTAEVTLNMGSAKATLPVPKGGCTPSGGQPTGSVMPSQPVTYCCR